ncbi:MAG: glycosyltransferase family 39 protein [bacterium]|jgi:hypothetical protein
MKTKLGGVFTWTAVTLLLVAFFVQGLWASANTGLTTDEFNHIASGVSYWKRHDFRMNTEHPTLTKWLAAMPVVLSGAKYPFESGSWEAKDQVWHAKDFWSANHENRKEILFLARIPFLLLSSLMCVFVFLFARSIYNEKAGILALFIFAFEPNIIAHASLANSDVPVAMMVLATLYFAHRYLFTLLPRHYILMLVFGSLAVITKFSALILPALVLLIHFYYLQNYPAQFALPQHLMGMRFPPKEGWARNLAFLAFTALWFAVIGLAFVLASYLFHLTVISPENSPNFTWLADKTIPEWLPGKDSLIEFAQKIPLPKEYIMGVYQVFFHNQIGHPAFLLGEHRIMGWWYYFPVVFFFKTPIPFLALIAASILLGFRKDREHWIAEAVLVIPILAYSALAIMSHLNFGVRHLLFIFPLLAIYASGVMAVDFKKRKFDPDEFRVGGKPKTAPTDMRPLALYSLIAGLSAFYLLSVFSQAPYYLAYMNELADGPSRRAYIMSDSNTDWGQGLPALDKWAKANGIDRPIHLYYKFNDDPSLYDFEYILENPENIDPTKFLPGEIYAVSIWIVNGMDCCTHYTLYDEQRKLANARWEKFKNLAPDAVVGGSIWIFAP